VSCMFGAKGTAVDSRLWKPVGARNDAAEATLGAFDITMPRVPLANYYVNILMRAVYSNSTHHSFVEHSLSLASRLLASVRALLLGAFSDAKHAIVVSSRAHVGR